MNQIFKYSTTESFDYVVKRQKRKTMALHVLPDASVEIRVPKWVPKREWLAFIEERADWVIQQRVNVLEKIDQQPGFSQGELHPYLGQLYPLKLFPGARTKTYLEQEELLIQLRNTQCSTSIEKALYQWYRKQAETVFQQRMVICYSLFPDWFQHRYTVPPITLRKMRRRWGSCSLKGEVTLNTHLIKMPVECIDYVIVHELCHLTVFNHSPEFYQLLSSVMPDWRARQHRLESQE